MIKHIAHKEFTDVVRDGRFRPNARLPSLRRPGLLRARVGAPSSCPLGLDVEEQAVAIGVPSGRRGAHEGGRGRLVGVWTSGFGPAGFGLGAGCSCGRLSLTAHYSGSASILSLVK